MASKDGTEELYEMEIPGGVRGWCRYQDYCELMAANLEGENYRNVSIENWALEHALDQNEGVDVIPI